MAFKANTENIAMAAISIIIVLGLIAIVFNFIFGSEVVYPIVRDIFRNEYGYGLFIIFLVIPISYLRRGLARNNRDDWLQKYGVTNEKVTRKPFCNKFNPFSNIFLTIYHITGIDRFGEPLEVYLAVDREWSVKDIIWVTKPIKV